MAGQLAVGVGLFEEQPGLVLEGGDGVGAGGEPELARRIRGRASR
jgi:hypothetical protein